MKKVLISGGSSGLGLELAKLYGKNGFQVLLVGRSVEKLQAAVNVLNLLEVSAVRVYSCDIGNQDQIKSLYEQVKQDHGKIDRLINCAGIGHFGPLSELSFDQIKQMNQVNFLGTVFMTKVFEEIVKERVVNIISTAGLKGKKNESVYCATKYAVRGFTESLHLEWADKDLNATAVYMGGMLTAFWDTNDHIKDKSRLRDPEMVARKIFEQEDGRPSIIIE